jgi:hypothetical protein
MTPPLATHYVMLPTALTYILHIFAALCTVNRYNVSVRGKSVKFLNYTQFCFKLMYRCLALAFLHYMC